MNIKYNKNIPLFGFIYAIFLGFIFFGIGYFLLSNIYHLFYEGIKTSGTVTAVEIDNDSDGIMYTPTVEYDCGGSFQENKYNKSSSYYSVGEKVTVYCDGNEPEKFMIKIFSNYLFFIFPLLGLIIILVGITGLFKEFIRRIIKRELLNGGVLVKGKLKSISKNGVMLGKDGYIVEALFNGKTYKSHTIYGDLQYVLKDEMR